ncbi:hypothetical protein [Amycolatopsis rhizosphaerae]|nr:hypothetical protein [Amycolatopsis rhizosphaerae]
MNRYELDAALREAGVPEAEYLIPGVSSPGTPRLDSYHVLRETGDGWLVSVWERGVEEPVRRFGSEEAACRHLYEHLTRRAPEPPPGSAETLAELAEHREEIQRRAWEQYHRARRDHD